MNLNPKIVGQWDGANAWVQWEPVERAAPRAFDPVEDPARDGVEGVVTAVSPTSVTITIDGAPRYRVQVRLRPPGGPWPERWLEIGQPSPRVWRVIQTVREGWEMQARVAVLSAQSSVLSAEAVRPASLLGTEHWELSTSAGSEPVWEVATEATFARCTARFSFTLAPNAAPLTLDPGSIFTAHVDGAACAYWLPTEAAEVISNRVISNHPGTAANPASLITNPLITSSPLHLIPGSTTEATLHSLHYTGFCQLDAPGDFLARPVRGLEVRNLTPSVNDLLVPPDARDFTLLSRLPRPGGPGQLVATGRRWDLPRGEPGGLLRGLPRV